MKRPIDPSEIRKGDLIRAERKKSAEFGESAHEYRAVVDQDNDGWASNKFNWYLLDRPAPAVELPKTPTLGRLTWKSFSLLGGDRGTRTVTAIWQKCASVSGGKYDQVISEDHSFHIDPSKVVTWEPLTAVPTTALDALMEEPTELRSSAQLKRIIDDFLAAVDEANA